MYIYILRFAQNMAQQEYESVLNLLSWLNTFSSSQMMLKKFFRIHGDITRLRYLRELGGMEDNKIWLLIIFR